MIEIKCITDKTVEFENQEMKKIIDGVLESQKKDMGVRIARAGKNLSPKNMRAGKNEVATHILEALCNYNFLKTREGDVVAKVQRADCAMLQSGSFRSKEDIKAGDYITKGTIRTNVPFTDEQTTLVEISGEVLKNILKFSHENLDRKNEDANFMQTANVQYEWKDGEIMNLCLAKFSFDANTACTWVPVQKEDRINLATTCYVCDKMDEDYIIKYGDEWVFRAKLENVFDATDMSHIGSGNSLFEVVCDYYQEQASSSGSSILPSFPSSSRGSTHGSVSSGSSSVSSVSSQSEVLRQKAPQDILGDISVAQAIEASMRDMTRRRRRRLLDEIYC